MKLIFGVLHHASRVIPLLVRVLSWSIIVQAVALRPMHNLRFVSGRFGDFTDNASAFIGGGTFSPGNSAIYGEWEDRYPDPADQSAELLRFVTAYKAGLDTFVDMTPYSPLLRSAADTNRSLTFYNFIDTWVANQTATPYIYMNNDTKQCTRLKASDGNGWSVSVKLIFWPRESTRDMSRANDNPAETRPRESITLASGTIGSEYPVGVVSLLEGNFSGDTVTLKEGTDFNEVQEARLYECNSTDQIQHASFLGYMAKRAEDLARMGSTDALQGFVDSTIADLTWAYLSEVHIHEVFHNNKTVRGTYDMDTVRPIVGMDVYYKPGTVVSDQLVDDVGRWWNMSAPFEPVGKILSVHNGTMFIRVNFTCNPDNQSFKLPGYVVPINNNVMFQVAGLVEEIVNIGKRAATNSQIVNSGKHQRELLNAPASVAAVDGVEVARALADAGPLLLRRNVGDGSPRLSENYVKIEPFGKLSLETTDSSNVGASLPFRLHSPGSSELKFSLLRTVAPGAKSGDGASSSAQRRSVCIVARSRHGRIFDRAFKMSNLHDGERVVAQLSVTGHGWASTTEQCGEYCHAVYSMIFNDGKPLKVTQFRDDCKNNPIGEGKQFGTWWESRNGWCPGSVQPGFFVDVTDMVQSGSNRLSFHLDVWSNVTGKYEPYTDLAGFALSDRASLSVGLTLFVYDRATVASVLAQDRAYTAAEAAIRQHSSQPSGGSLQIPTRPDEPVVLRLSQSAAQAVIDPSPSLRGSSEPQGRFDFEARAPWYLYNSSEEGDLVDRMKREAVRSGATAPVVVEIFRKQLVQSNTRTILEKIPSNVIPKDWRQVALHFQLEKPQGKLDFDHWDRQGSFGLFFPDDFNGAKGISKTNQPSTQQSDHRLRIRPASKPQQHSHWPVDFHKSATPVIFLDT
eukprot:TRINITY_DN49428_c0_g1_i1.p1 TRINITY_DN49428_c0_g1~~TRINITY_DN49428_c0_g1_i1.p1  ORF type:complete len:908 (+),score=95.67 TRINITY_DN49428_c0_g1_i1:132-2855(+)